jgi:HK97 family phage portal protein
MGLFASTSTAPTEGERRSFIVPVGAPESSYSSVDGSTLPGSLQSVAVGSTVDLICSLGSELPVDVFRGEGSERKRVPTPGYLLDPAGDGSGLEDFAYQTLMSWTMRGNLYGDVLQRHRTGYVTQCSLFYPDDVRGQEEGGKVVWYVKGRPFRGDFLHRRVMPIPGHVLGRSPVAMHAATIGVSLAATRFGGQWFTDGAHPTALLTSEQKLDEGKARTAKTRFMETMGRKREPLVLGGGWDYKPLQLNPEESQFLETQGYSEAQCARIFGPGFAEILGYESGGNLTYANIESRATHLLVFGMNRWLRRFERLLSSMLPSPQYARLDRDAMLETTTLTRYQAHALALDKRWKVVNEVRADEDLPPVSWGDEPNASQASLTVTGPSGDNAPNDGGTP